MLLEEYQPITILVLNRIQWGWKSYLFLNIICLGRVVFFSIYKVVNTYKKK